MIAARKLLYVLTDGGRARFLERSAATHDFTAIEELTEHHRVKDAGVEARGEMVRRAKEAFMAQVAARAGELVRRPGVEGVFLAAPPRLIKVLQSHLPAGTPLAGQIGKDLVKVPDHELHTWLDAGAFGLQPMR